ncbi:MAG: aromatic ring-hydroxylating dioxygenase subunit alpha [Rhodanobacteraceae bacterium]|nr:aromatic ring-hydroxylating dioxygenase subunit alpha [Rhodanobacteraceae bacterium]
MSDALFNHPRDLAQGWYWLCASAELRRGQVKALRLLGRDLAVYRGEDGAVVALDAYCAHMGAHLAEGRVEGNHLRCFFHHWRYAADGRCDEIPCQPGTPPAKARVRCWPTAERYGLVWLWTGAEAAHGVPEVPELAGMECRSWRVSRFRKNCHPNVVLINAIDEQHFHSVHNLPGEVLQMQPLPRGTSNIEFHNVGKVPARNVWWRLIGRCYRNALTYNLSYWYGSTGFVTLGPDFLHCHILFALRRGDAGETQGCTVALTRRRSGLFGALFDRVVLALTAAVGAYFARGDTRVFQTIRFDLRTPIAADRAVLAFIRHFEQQPRADWQDGATDTAATRHLHPVAGADR